MKLTTIIAAALPLLAMAAPRSIFEGGYQADGSLPSTHTQQGDWAAAPGGSDQDDHQPPAEFDQGFNSGIGNGDMTGGDITQAHGDHMHEQRDLEARDDVDHYIQECSTPSTWAQDRTCVNNLVVPKGQQNGGCVARMQVAAWSGTIHLLDSNVMCKYYKNPGCTGRMSGPYSNEILDYTWESVYYGQIMNNPQSFFCEMIGFQEPRLPVQPPEPDPRPSPNDSYDGKLDHYLQLTHGPLALISA